LETTIGGASGAVTKVNRQLNQQKQTKEIMKSIKHCNWRLAVVLFASALLAWNLFAQTNGPVAPVTDAPPADLLGWVNMLIVAATPLVIAGIKWLRPRIPSVALPFIAPVIGVALDQLTALVSGHQSNVVLGAAAGGVGVWLREIVDQSKKQLTAAPKQQQP